MSVERKGLLSGMIQEARGGGNTVFFICSPSLGILDSWLPVIHELQRHSSELRVVVVFPQLRTAREIDSGNVLTRIAGQLIAGALIPSGDGGWVYVDSLEAAKREAEVRKQSRALDRLGPVAAKVFGAVRRMLTTRAPKLAPDETARLFDSVGAVLMDIYEYDKPYNKTLMSVLAYAPKFSIAHGIGILTPTAGDEVSGCRTAFHRVYVESRYAVSNYEDAYGIPASVMAEVGIPRHEKAWIDRIVESDERSVPFEDGYIFVISRPGKTTYFPRERKREALERIWRLSTDTGRRVVVKLHPKEKDEGLYNEVFGEENRGTRWIYTNGHPYTVAGKALFAVAFYSGVPIDMTVMGVPTIELLDLRGIPEYDNQDSLRDEAGNPCLTYRKQGLVLGASDYSGLRNWAERIERDRKGVIALLQRRYEELFRDPEGVNMRIAAEIRAVTSSDVS